VKLILSAHIGPHVLSIIFQQTSSLHDLTTREYPVLNHLKSINNKEMMT
jgi:hypothetical protein